MGHVEVAGVRFELPDGRVLLDDVSFRVGDGAKVALVGANGAGKTTLLRIITGELTPQAGAVTRSGGLGVMRQLVARRLDHRGRDAPVRLAAPGPGGRRRGRPPRAGADGRRQRVDADGLCDGAVRVRRRRRLRHRGRLGHLLHGGAGRGLREGEGTATSTRSVVASRSDWCWSTSSQVPTRCRRPGTSCGRPWRVRRSDRPSRSTPGSRSRPGGSRRPCRCSSRAHARSEVRHYLHAVGDQRATALDHGGELGQPLVQQLVVHAEGADLLDEAGVRGADPGQRKAALCLLGSEPASPTSCSRTWSSVSLSSLSTARMTASVSSIPSPA